MPASTEITATIINSETTTASLRKPDSQLEITGIHPRGLWLTGQFNTALPHVRQQRPTQNGYGNNYSQGGNQLPENQNGNGYGNHNGNYARPQTGYQNGYQRPTNGGGYNNGQRYRTMPSQVGIGVQPRVLR